MNRSISTWMTFVNIERPRHSEDSVLSILLKSIHDESKDHHALHWLLTNARTNVNEFVKGHVIVKNQTGSVFADKVLHALVDDARHEYGQRYVSKIILSCKQFQGHEEQTEYLALLANAWFTHF